MMSPNRRGTSFPDFPYIYKSASSDLVILLSWIRPGSAFTKFVGSRSAYDQCGSTSLVVWLHHWQTDLQAKKTGGFIIFQKGRIKKTISISIEAVWNYKRNKWKIKDINKVTNNHGRTKWVIEQMFSDHKKKWNEERYYKQTRMTTSISSEALLPFVAWPTDKIFVE